MSLACVFTCTSESYALIYSHVIADLGGLAYDDCHSVVDEATPAYLGSRMYLYPGEPPRYLRNDPGQELHMVPVQPVRRFMENQGPYPRIAQQYLQSCPCCRVLLKYSLYIFFYVSKKCHYVYSSSKNLKVGMYTHFLYYHTCGGLSIQYYISCR